MPAGLLPDYFFFPLFFFLVKVGGKENAYSGIGLICLFRTTGRPVWPCVRRILCVIYGIRGPGFSRHDRRNDDLGNFGARRYFRIHIRNDLFVCVSGPATFSFFADAGPGRCTLRGNFRTSRRVLRTSAIKSTIRLAPLPSGSFWGLYAVTSNAAICFCFAKMESASDTSPNSSPPDAG